MRAYLSDRRKRLKTIKNGKGVQHILDEASRILGNPILIHNMEYELIAYAGNPVSRDPIWVEFITNGRIGHDRFVFYKEEYFLYAVANARKVAFLISDKLKYHRIFGKVYTKYNVQIGGAIIMESDKPFAEDDTELFEAVCEILTSELSSDEYYQNYGQSHREALITKLIEGKIKDREIYVAHVADIYDGLGAYLHLIIADITQCDSEHTQLAYFRDLFRQTEPAFKYAIYSNYIVIIMSTNNAAFDVKKDLKKLKKIFAENNIYAGIRSDSDNLFELQKYYNEAVSALNYGMKTEDERRVFVYDAVK